MAYSFQSAEISSCRLDDSITSAEELRAASRCCKEPDVPDGVSHRKSPMVMWLI